MSAKPIERVAIVGASGRIGGAFTEALVKTGKHTVTALVRAESTGKVAEGAKVVKLDYNDEAALVDALKGQQFLVITLSARAPQDLHEKIAAAAVKAGVPYIMPNVYSYPVEPGAPISESDFSANLTATRVAEIEKLGGSWIILSCGFWYEWSLALGESWFGISIKDRKVTFFDDGKRLVTVSTWDQCGRALAGLLSLPETGPSPSLADFVNKHALISSFRLTQRDMLDSVHRVLGTTDADWEIRYEPSAKRLADGAEEFKKGDIRGFAKNLYAFVFLPSTKLSDYQEQHNGVLGLPVEDLDEATKRAVDMVESGWNPFDLA
ncbi:hypothetical protein VTK26DRAFT_4792 [Humicola hyalothermophila]